MKIAVVTADGVGIHAHFGQAPYFEVLTIEEGQATARERREKSAHNGHHTHGEEHYHACRHSHAEEMAEAIQDCQVLLARGMGEPAYRALRAAGIEPLLVAEMTIDEAVQAYLQGNLQHHAERLHRH